MVLAGVTVYARLCGGPWPAPTPAQATVSRVSLEA
jgi:hypothetical protein